MIGVGACKTRRNTSALRYRLDLLSACRYRDPVPARGSGSQQAPAGEWLSRRQAVKGGLGPSPASGHRRRIVRPSCTFSRVSRSGGASRRYETSAASLVRTSPSTRIMIGSSGGWYARSSRISSSYVPLKRSNLPRHTVWLTVCRSSHASRPHWGGRRRGLARRHSGTGVRRFRTRVTAAWPAILGTTSVCGPCHGRGGHQGARGHRAAAGAAASRGPRLPGSRWLGVTRRCEAAPSPRARRPATSRFRRDRRRRRRRGRTWRLTSPRGRGCSAGVGVTPGRAHPARSRTDFRDTAFRRDRHMNSRQAGDRGEAAARGCRPRSA